MGIELAAFGRRRNDGTFVLVGWYWYRNGSWSARYEHNGERLCYAYFGPVLLNRQFTLCISLPTLFLRKAENAWR
jgi:hypothetical protein